MARFIEIDIENEDEIMARIDANMAAKRRRVHDMLDDVADFGEHVLRRQVPRDSDYLYDHIGRSPLVWVPGGSGGGGQWQTTFGIQQGSSDHPYYVEFGTGIYGTVGNMIAPRTQPFMVFYGTRAGRVLHKKLVRGQKPQRYFYTTWREVQIFAQARAIYIGMNL